jgi:hypothetical protein
MANAPVADPKTTTPAKPTLVPPEEQFWIRYSPHNEAPLSGVSSSVLHVLAILLVLLVIWIKNKLDPEEEQRPVPVDTAQFAPDAAVVEDPGGGGGHKKGRGDGPGVGKVGEDDPMETGGGSSPPKLEAPPPPQPINLPPAQMTKVEGEYDNDPAIKRIIAQGNEQAEILFKMDETLRKKLRKNVVPPPGAGRGGSGSGGGRDKGKDKGEGSGTGPGQGKLTQREKRVLRWSMLFNTANGTDYRNQLHGLGAIIALPQSGDRFKVIRNLMNPAAGKVEDISDIKRIYWVDEKPQSVQSLCTALGERVPPYFVAFFPLKLEQELLDRELAALKRLDPRATEDDIERTHFDVKKGDGKYYVTVNRVTLRRR